MRSKVPKNPIIVSTSPQLTPRLSSTQMAAAPMQIKMRNSCQPPAGTGKADADADFEGEDRAQEPGAAGGCTASAPAGGYTAVAASDECQDHEGKGRLVFYGMLCVQAEGRATDSHGCNEIKCVKLRVS